jgi:hypothetical protein
MDDSRFDDLTKALARARSRRAVLRRAAAFGVAALAGLSKRDTIAAQDEKITTFEIDAGGGGTANAGVSGGTISGGDIVTGGNGGTEIVTGDTVGGEGGNATVTIDGGSSTTITQVDVSADGGTAGANASGGDGNTVAITIEETAPPPPSDPCAGVTCVGGDACTNVVCRAGACVTISARNGESCPNADGNACTEGVCRDGVCATEPVPDGTPCLIDNIQASCFSGTCVFPALNAQSTRWPRFWS